MHMHNKPQLFAAMFKHNVSKEQLNARENATKKRRK